MSAASAVGHVEALRNVLARIEGSPAVATWALCACVAILALSVVLARFPDDVLRPDAPGMLTQV